MTWAPVLLTFLAHCTGGCLHGNLGVWTGEMIVSSQIPRNWPCLDLTNTLFHSTLSGSWAEVVFTQPQFVSGSLGQKITISCTHSTGNIESNYVYWHQKHSASAPRLLIYNYDQRPSGVPARFSGSKDRSYNSGILTISGLQAEDEADYHCLSGYDNYFTQSLRLMGNRDKNSLESHHPGLHSTLGNQAFLSCFRNFC